MGLRRGGDGHSVQARKSESISQKSKTFSLIRVISGPIMFDGSQHSAAGQMAGYLFQPERALYHLATSPLGSSIGIETLDDVSVRMADGKEVREQNKHYLSSKKVLGNSDRGFWKTLLIWLEAVSSGEADLKVTSFCLVTNQILTKGLAADLLNAKAAKSSLRSWISAMRGVAKNAPSSLKEFSEKIIAFSDTEIEELVLRVSIFDGRAATSGTELRKGLSDSLHLPQKDSEAIINSLLGWVHDTTLALLRSGKRVWLTREAFDHQLRQQIYLYQDKRFVRETAEALLPVTEEDRKRNLKGFFVKQLVWVGLSNDDPEVLEAIEDYVRSTTETVRLAEKGLVNPQDFRSFNDRLVKRWRALARQTFPKPLPSSRKSVEELGLKLFRLSMNHREPLAGQETVELYLTQGAYHQLADSPPKLGWHPEYEKRIAKSTPKEKK